MAIRDNLYAEQLSEWLKLYEMMTLIRQSEAMLSKVSKDGKLPGGVHLAIGQEASAAGVGAALEVGDYLTSTHRGHAHFLAKGGDINQMFAEIWGKRTGICKGMGGSMHVADVSKGILGANAIVGGGLAIATGAGLGAKLAGDGAVAVCMFGDGAANQGVFVESMNCAKIWSIPVIFVCENNGFSEFTPSGKITAGTLTGRASALELPSVMVDGNDVLAVRDAMREAVARAREGGGPSFLEVKTYRITGHLEAEDAFLAGYSYRTKEDIDAWRTPDKDPLLRFAAKLIEEGGATRADLEAIEDAVRQKVEAAVAFAESSEEADPALALELM